LIDGRIIAQLMSVLTGKPLPFKLKPSENKLQCVGNLQQALAFIADQGIRLSVGPEGLYLISRSTTTTTTTTTTGSNSGMTSSVVCVCV
jgi:hypothetical protein